MAEYIERRAFLAELKKHHDYVMQDPEISNLMKWREAVCFGRTKDILNATPAADVVEVVHGRWVQVICHVEFEDGFVDRLYECCSRCHKPNGRKMTGYCPNCGADMLVGEEEKLESRSKAYVTDKNVGNIIPVNDLYDEDGADVQNT